MHPSWILVRLTGTNNDQPIKSTGNQKFNKIILDNNVDIYSIGRARDNVINCVSIYVSRRHCYIKRKDEKMFIVDLGSANGTFVNNRQILANREIPLVAGDVIGLGISEYLSKECFVYKLSKDSVDDQPSCIVLSDSEEECIPNVEKEPLPSFTRKRLLDSSDPVPHKVPRLSHFQIKEEPKVCISAIPSSSLLVLNSGETCLGPTLISSDPVPHKVPRLSHFQIKEEPKDRISAIPSSSLLVLNSGETCLGPTLISEPLQSELQIKVKTECLVDQESAILNRIVPSIKCETDNQTSDGNSQTSSLFKSEMPIKSVKSESNISETNNYAEIVNNESQAAKPKSESDSRNSCPVVCSGNKYLSTEENSTKTIKNELNSGNNTYTENVNKESEAKPKSSTVVMCSNTNTHVKGKVKKLPNTGSAGVLHEPNNLAGAVNNSISSNVLLKELSIKLERIDSVIPKYESSICNYTLEDDIIVISDDEELFPSSQIFDEEHFNVKQEEIEENPCSEGKSAAINSHNTSLVCIEDDNIIDDHGYMQNFEGIDSDDSDDNEWLTKLSQTYFNEDLKSGDTKKLNDVLTYNTKKQDDMEISNSSAQSQDESQLLVPRHKKVKPICVSDDEDSNLPSLENQKKKISSKPILIEAPPLKKPKRSVQPVTKKKESKTERNTSQPIPKVSKKQQPKAAILERVLRKMTNGPACIKDKNITATVNNRRSSSEQMSNITEERKKKLKAIAEHSKNMTTSSTKAKHYTHCTKLTEKTRGEYLVESMKPTKIVHSSEIGKKENKQCIKTAQTLKKSDKNKDAKHISLQDKKSDSYNCKSVSDLPKIPRIKTIAPSIDAQPERVSPLQCSPLSVPISYSKQFNTKVSPMCSSSVVSSENITGMCKPLKQPISCLKKVTINDKIRNSKNVSFDTLNLTTIKTYEIPAGSKLIPLGSIKDAPIPKLVVAGCNLNSEVSKFLNEIIGLICQWNPKWLEEQKQKKEPPPLLNMKLYPMLTSFSSYDDYKTILVPLMVHNIWQIIYTDVETAKLSRLPVLIFHMEKCDKYDSKTMRIKCSAVMGPKDTNIYPKLGDLVIAEIQLNPPSLPKADSKASQETHGNRLFANCFAYVERSNIERCKSLTNFNNKFCTSFSASQTKLSLSLCVKYHAYKDNTPIRLKILKYIRSDLRQFQGLAALATSPLCELILKPSYSMYKLPKEGTEALWTKDSLNSEQKKAVLECAAACMKNDPKICLIQGPPGTGKSTVIKNLVMQILYGRNDYNQNKHRRKSRCPRILLCAPSNAGIDELVERLLAVRQTLSKDKRFKMVRVGNTRNMRGLAKDISLEELAKKEVRSTAENFQNDPESLELEFRCIEAKRKCYLSNLESSSSLSEISRIAIQSKILSLDFKMKQLEQSKNQVSKSSDQKLADERKAQIAILQGADIVATTLNSCFTNLMESIFGPNSNSHNKFTCCIIDEATQCSEPESLIPLLHGISTLVLVGDTEQLPATIISNEAKKLGFGQSLFSRIQNCFVGQETPVHMLTVQYRMHPEICLWPNMYFYMGKLKNGPDIAEKRRSNLLPYVILSLDSVQDSLGELKNSREAEFVKKLSLAIAETNSKMRISIITPYNKQRQEIEHLLDLSNHKFGSRIEVNTIDSSQGQEREVVIMSCTRTDGVGFLTRTERLNVALTRARNSLILCGNFKSLLNDGMWRSLIKNAQERKCYKEIVLSEVRPKNILQIVQKQ